MYGRMELRVPYRMYVDVSGYVYYSELRMYVDVSGYLYYPEICP